MWWSRAGDATAASGADACGYGLDLRDVHKHFGKTRIVRGLLRGWTPESQ